jgi:hypothetical protein
MEFVWPTSVFRLTEVRFCDAVTQFYAEANIPPTILLHPQILIRPSSRAKFQKSILLEHPLKRLLCSLVTLFWLTLGDRPS